jgi:hypothetical protein
MVRREFVKQRLGLPLIVMREDKAQVGITTRIVDALAVQALKLDDQDARAPLGPNACPGRPCR